MILTTQIEDKTIVWLKEQNQYIIVENIVSEILLELEKNTDIDCIIELLKSNIDIPYNEALTFIDDVRLLLKKEDSDTPKIELQPVPNYFDFEKYYKINGLIFLVEFLSEYELSLIHPKFAHLEVTSQISIDHKYTVFLKNDIISFLVDNENIGSWIKSESHYFQGKFSMKIIEHTHKHDENEWMGIFHASAVADNDSCILFLGDSGNGKSTSLALLQANGFSCLADDFVPILSKTRTVHSFPSAISIKKNSLPVLLTLYPELQNQAEYHFEKLNKIVRYLPPKKGILDKQIECKKLVFIKYEKDSELQLNKISKLEAFKQLIPDSWLSPHPENAKNFLDWFEELTCYSLIYSNNEKMIATSKKLFADEL
ncbi:hypothetical protein SAMN04489761_1719 [Tenacibaculum sp. MAR_2009_124]|uniref:hypothetical protein n=1 Tax=Tenacibaculum sp. MAR_2009_124 TaxID=1250059 RepID=UPI000898689F|nr:hypothetical protein [Tenacibaculum sp. MAR_2009_124]SEB77101.1 hypothetical protein SAMN04489761_1719 [Tenacibaculum sp. MAR_2009_124]